MGKRIADVPNDSIDRGSQRKQVKAGRFHANVSGEVEGTI